MPSIVVAIVKAILKATVILLVNKGRDWAAEKLKDGDVTDQQFRNLVARELDDIKSKIEGLARKDLLASISFYKEGLEIFYQFLDQSELREDETVTNGQSRLSVSTAISLVEELKMLKLNELSEKSRQILADAKTRFKEARRKATDAFCNTVLKTSDRVLAMKIRILATLMENVESPSTSALVSCRFCLEELHNTPAIQNCFKVEVTKPIIKYRFYKNERRKVIAGVCSMNFAVYSVLKIVGGDWRDVFKLPFIDIRELKIDPLRDSRLIEALNVFKLERCFLEWTFGQEGDMNHRLKRPQGITTNTQGQFIVAESLHVKVFDPSGNFLRSLFPLTDDDPEQLQRYPLNVATGGKDNLYVVHASLEKGWERDRVELRDVYVFDRHYNLLHKFPLKERVYNSMYWPSLTVSDDGKVFVLVKYRFICEVDVYETDGRFVNSFGREILTFLARDITIANDDRLMVLVGYISCVHVFSTQGDHLYQFTVQGSTMFGAIAFHRASEHVIVSSRNPDNENRGQVSIYTKDGEFVRCVQVDTDKLSLLPGLTVTGDGSIAVINAKQNKVHIIKLN